MAQDDAELPEQSPSSKWWRFPMWTSPLAATFVPLAIAVLLIVISLLVQFVR